MIRFAPVRQRRTAARFRAALTTAFAIAGFWLVLVADAARAQLGAGWNVELLARTGQPSDRGTYAAVWGYTAPDGTELAMIGGLAGTDIYDVSDPRHPLLVTDIPGPRSHWREMQTWSHYAYIVTEGTGVESRGVQIVDLADPGFPVVAGDFDSTFVTAHSIHLADGYAYVNGTNNGWRILDLADPEHPRDVGGWNVRYVHDCYVRGDLAYLANINNGGFTILDISDRAHPQELSFTQYGGAATHNCWTTEDGRFLLTTDEVSGGHLHIWNVENPASPYPVSEWSSLGSASIHNVVVRGDSAYIAYYTEGLQVLDVKDPAAPLLVGSYDTYPGGLGLYDGNWGVYPLARSGNIYLSDINSGLFVVRMSTGGQPVQDFLLTSPPGQTTSPGQTQVWFFFDIYNAATGGRTFDIEATNSAGWPMTVVSSIHIPSLGSDAVFVKVEVPPGITEPTRVDVDLCATSQNNQVQLCGSTRIAVPVTLQEFTATAHDGSVDLEWRLEQSAADRGELVVLRAARPDAGPPVGFEIRARLGLESRGWRDAGLDPGTAWVYRLVLADDAGARVLGEREVTIAAPSVSRVLGNNPNPFNPTTTIRFELAHAGDVALRIFDARGRRVRGFDLAALAAGGQAVIWDGRDAAGRGLPSGVYLYEVRSAGWTGHGRMTLAK